MNTLIPKHLTIYQIADRTDNKEGLANIRAINALFRAQDESHLWPVRNRFNVTERAIRRVRKLTRQNGAIYGIEYAATLEYEISQIVNGVL